MRRWNAVGGDGLVCRGHCNPLLRSITVAKGGPPPLPGSPRSTLGPGPKIPPRMAVASVGMQDPCRPSPSSNSPASGRPTPGPDDESGSTAAAPHSNPGQPVMSGRRKRDRSMTSAAPVPQSGSSTMQWCIHRAQVPGHRTGRTPYPSDARITPSRYRCRALLARPSMMLNNATVLKPSPSVLGSASSCCNMFNAS